MAEITWSLQALDDLTAIADFHARTSPTYAAVLVEAIYGAMSQIARFPASGRIVPEANISTLREVVVRNYRVIYANIDYERVEILAVRSCLIPLKDFKN